MSNKLEADELGIPTVQDDLVSVSTPTEVLSLIIDRRTRLPHVITDRYKHKKGIKYY
jgi:hypothetical protein